MNKFSPEQRIIESVRAARRAPEAAVHVEFVNELNNDIIINISSFDDEKYDGVLVVMEGPSSTASNSITRMEAEELQKALTSFLSK